jgi:hypothetical protein
MNFPNSVARWLQSSLLELAEDDTTCGGLITGAIEGIPDDTLGRWQFGVDMIYRLVKCELAIIPYFQIRCHDETSFFLAIRTLSPFDRSGGLLWNGTFLRGTDGLQKLMKRHFSSIPRYAPLLNPPFVKELEEIFVLHNVPWSETPLLPIAPESH